MSITNDWAAILQNMLVEDPVAKKLVDLASQEDHDVRGGTTSVELLGANLIEKRVDLMLIVLISKINATDSDGIPRDGTGLDLFHCV